MSSASVFSGCCKALAESSPLFPLLALEHLVLLISFRWGGAQHRCLGYHRTQRGGGGGESEEGGRFERESSDDIISSLFKKACTAGPTVPPEPFCLICKNICVLTFAVRWICSTRASHSSATFIFPFFFLLRYLFCWLLHMAYVLLSRNTEV